MANKARHQAEGGGKGTVWRLRRFELLLEGERRLGSTTVVVQWTAISGGAGVRADERITIATTITNIDIHHMYKTALDSVTCSARTAGT